MTDNQKNSFLQRPGPWRAEKEKDKKKKKKQN